MSLYELRNSAKNGNAVEAFSHLGACNSADMSLNDRENAGWIIFYFIRQSGLEDTQAALDLYIKLEIPHPSMLHSNILRLVGKRGGEWYDFDTYLYISRLKASFRDEDYDSTYYRDNEIPPLVESVFSDCYDKGMTFNQAVGLFRRQDSPEETENARIVSLYGKCIYRKLWQFNKEKDDELKSYTLVNRYLEETEGLPRKGMMHSNILNSIIWDTHDETSGWFKELFEKWGMDSFREEDWEKVHKGDEVYDSLAEKAISKYILAMKITRQSPSPGFRVLISEALTHYPSDETYLRYDARYRQKDGDSDGAASLYRNMILTGNKYYLWSELAELLTDSDQKIGCLSKAILMQRDDNFLGNIRLTLADLLIAKQMFAEAAYELKIYEDTYRRNNWNIRNAFNVLKEKIPHNIVPVGDNVRLYRKYEIHADEFIYSELPTEEVLMTGHKSFEVNGRRKKRLLMLGHDGYVFEVNPNVFNIRNAIKNRSLFMARVDRRERRPKVVWLKSSGEIQYQEGTIDNINQAKGCFHITGDAGLSVVARMDRTSFTPALHEKIRVATYKITRPDGRIYNRIIDIKQD